MHSVMSHQFSMIPQAQIERSSFDRSHGYKTTFDSGYLIPVYVDEALPGDTFNLHMAAFARMATPIKPIMDNLFLDSFFFAVPIRLVWSNFKRFMGEQPNPTDSTDFKVPTFDKDVTGTTHLAALGSIGDYFGIPDFLSNTTTVNSLHHRAYNLIWNEWFRDQNLQTSVPVPLTDGPDDPDDFVLLKRGKRHDYFTSCLPWPQKGPDVLLPLGDSAPVLGIMEEYVPLITNSVTGIDSTSRTPSQTRNYAHGIEAGSQTAGHKVWLEQVAMPSPYQTDGYPNIRADLSAATAATINSLRQAFQLQRLLERDARGGTRYTEIIRAHFGVVSPDARLQRPEYLGGGSTPINIHPIAQTSNTPASGTPQGNLAAFGTAMVQGNGFTKSFTEHCLLIGLVSVRADLTYQQGLDRMFSRQTRYDFYWPALAHLGEQAVLSKELYCNGDSHDNDVFGYQERYAEYRYKPSRITGKYRSGVTGSLDIWHLAQQFSPRPTLGPTFIMETPPMSRVMAVNTEPQFLFDAYFQLKCARPMPVYGVPGMIDHF